jgi:hypothetical protein
MHADADTITSAHAAEIGPLEEADRLAWIALAELCAALHARWYETDRTAARPRLFDHWRPICARPGLPPESGIIKWHELEVAVSWIDRKVALSVLLPTGAWVNVTAESGAWNAVAREALAKLQALAEHLHKQLPDPPAGRKERRMEIGPLQAAARRQMQLAQRIMQERLDEDG